MDRRKGLQEIFYCDNDVEYRVFCNICDNLCIEHFHKNHLKSQTDTKKICKRGNKNQQAHGNNNKNLKQSS